MFLSVLWVIVTPGSSMPLIGSIVTWPSLSAVPTSKLLSYNQLPLFLRLPPALLFYSSIIRGDSGGCFRYSWYSLSSSVNLLVNISYTAASHQLSILHILVFTLGELIYQFEQFFGELIRIFYTVSLQYLGVLHPQIPRVDCIHVLFYIRPLGPIWYLQGLLEPIPYGY